MKPSARLFHCARCQSQVVLCQRCDRGQRYCSAACSHAARFHSRCAAQRRYQQSRRGRLNHAHRQRCYRQRLSKKVTHHSSNRVKQTRDFGNALRQRAITHCHLCHCVVSCYLRRDFLHSSVMGKGSGERLLH